MESHGKLRRRLSAFCLLSSESLFNFGWNKLNCWDKILKCVGRIEKNNENTSSFYGRALSGLEQWPSRVAGQEKRSSSPAAEATSNCQ